jgi:hypothetical protein
MLLTAGTDRPVRRTATWLCALCVIATASAHAQDTTTAAAAVADSAAPSNVPDPSELARLQALVARSVHLSGMASMNGELYGVQGIEARRPGTLWRMSLTPQLTAFGRVSVGMNALLSSEGGELTAGSRQNFTQLGLTPRWRWGSASVGDFSQTFSPYTVQGVRVRGAGFDLRPGRFRFALQGGRTQRSVSLGVGEPVFRRYLAGVKVGYGREGSSFLDLGLVKVKDDVNSVERALILRDTLLLDTIPEFLRPRVDVRPQENLVLSLGGQVALFDRSLTVRGEAAGALITHDLSSPGADPAAVGGPGLLYRLHPLHLSTSGDYAVNVNVALRRSAFGLQGGYEYVGAGYTSLGLPYLISDRQSYQFAGNTQLLKGRVGVQAQYQHQNDNLLDQKQSTTSRDVITGMLLLRPAQLLTLTLSGVGSFIGNDAVLDSARLDNRTLALNANAGLQLVVRQRPTTVSLAYGLQTTDDGGIVVPIPSVRIHNVTSSVQVALTRSISVAPSLSAVLKQVDQQEDETNLLLGFRGAARMFDGKLSSSTNVTHSFAQGREVFSVVGNAGYDMPHGARLSLQARFNRFGAFGPRPAFSEELSTLTLSRSF